MTEAEHNATQSHIAPSGLPSAVPVIIVADATSAEQDDEEVDASAFFSYLATPQGHEIAKGVLEIFQDVKKAALTHTAGQAKLEKVFQFVIVGGVVAAASLLANAGKLDSTTGVLFGTLIGYVFGRKA